MDYKYCYSLNIGGIYAKVYGGLCTIRNTFSSSRPPGAREEEGRRVRDPGNEVVCNTRCVMCMDI